MLSRPALALVASLALVSALAACGGGDETSTTTGASGASGAQDLEVDAGLTAGEFLALPIPDQLSAVEDVVADNSDCDGVDTSAGGDLQVAVAIDAAQATADTPFADVVADSC